MAEDTKDDLIEIRTFASMEEIRALPNFREQNGVHAENYSRLYGDYWFSDEVKCCFKKPNGHLCGEDHKKGFVVQLKDETITIVGNICARDRFAADARIRTDRNRYINEKRRRHQLQLLEEMLADKEKRLVELDALKARVAAVMERVRKFTDSLGNLTTRKLQDMARTGNSSVSVDAITYKEYTDDEGFKRTERRVAPHRLGGLSGLSIFREHEYLAINSQIADVRDAYRKAETFNENTRTSDLEAVSAALGDCERIALEAEKLEQDENAFFSGDLWLLCFVVDDKAERYKTARIVLERSGEIAGKDRAKSWLAEREQELKQSLGADKIGVQ